MVHIHAQVDEARGLISEEYLDWVAGYLVLKRASIEPNFHSLYMKFMDLYGSLQLYKQVLRETYRNIKVRYTLCVATQLLLLTIIVIFVVIILLFYCYCCGYCSCQYCCYYCYIFVNIVIIIIIVVVIIIIIIIVVIIVIVIVIVIVIIIIIIIIQVILQADKTSNNFSDRAILKNLGHWLGMQTLAKNKPILHIVSVSLDSHKWLDCLFVFVVEGSCCERPYT